jgi:O-acetyl-ADP-ribose deacetylase (regulator of RNase III)
MLDVLKALFGNAASVLVFVSAVFFLAGLIGIVPTGADLDKALVLSGLQRTALIVAALLIPLGFAVHRYLQLKQTAAPSDPDYNDRFHAEQKKLKDIVPAKQLLAEEEAWGPRIVVINDNIVNATAQVIVSSDDNHLQAKGGVAKAVVENAGPAVLRELVRRRSHRLKQGDLAITSGGDSGALAILHPAVIDLDEHRYPNQQLIRKIVRRSLACATALGAESIAFPVLGGGTGSKHLTPWESIQAMLGEIVSFVRTADVHGEDGLTFIGLYVFNPADIRGELRLLLSPPAG